MSVAVEGRLGKLRLDEIARLKFDALSSCVGIDASKKKSIYDKLIDYRYISCVDELAAGRYIRWINRRKDTNRTTGPLLTNGGMVLNVSTYDYYLPGSTTTTTGKKRDGDNDDDDDDDDDALLEEEEEEEQDATDTTPSALRVIQVKFISAKNSPVRQIIFEDCLVFQKLSVDEKLLIAAQEHLAKKGD